jgi:hypothetical protein
MNRNRLLLGTACLGLASMLGCSQPYYPPSPPPPPVAQVPPLIQLADRNGFQTGRADGARDANTGYPFQARRTRAYHQTPGYDPVLGPFPAYRDAFRNSYLRGYDVGFYHR